MIPLHSLILEKSVLLLVIANGHVVGALSLLKSVLYLTISSHVLKGNCASYLRLEWHARTATKMCRIVVHLILSTKLVSCLSKKCFDTNGFYDSHTLIE